MRKTLSIIFAAVIAAQLTAAGQDKYGGNIDCVKNLSLYQEYMKKGQISEAAPLWRKAFAACPPTASQNMLLDGLKIIRKDIIASKNDPGRVRELVDTVRLLHRLRIDNYPKYSRQAYSALATDMLNFCAQLDPAEVLEAVGIALKASGDKTPASVPAKYAALASKLYESGTIDASAMLEAYGTASDALNAGMTAADENGKAEYAKAAADLDRILTATGVADCKTLTDIYGPKYEAAPDDKALLSAIVKSMSAQNCTDRVLFRKAAESLHRLEPSVNSAGYLFRLCADAGETDKAVAYMQEAISLPESDAATDAGCYFELAQFLYLKARRNADAYKAARAAEETALKLNDAHFLGKLYLFIAQLWGSVRCGENELEARTPYWVATDYLVKAKKADPTLTEEADRLAAAYRAYFPTQADAFMYNVKDGDPFTVSCGGMYATTTVRTQKN